MAFSVSMNTAEVWQKRLPADDPELRKSPRGVIAMWVGEQPEHEVVLYEDGACSGNEIPVDLLPHLEAAWMNWMERKLRDG